MKILFFCGSLEPGRDGVGDYTRRLASELIRQGHQAAIIALNDLMITEPVQGMQESEGTALSILRLPSILSAKERFALTEVYMQEFDPEWLSLQYVPFAFQDKGLPFSLSKHLAKIGTGRKWHVMFHELWVGIDSEASSKLKLWGNLQREIIRRMINSIKPIVIHTQTNIYQLQLQKIGYKASKLPLFSNVPLFKQSKHGKLTEYSIESKADISLILFGSIHPGAPVENFIRELSNHGQNNRKTISITFIGRTGTYIQEWLSICNQLNIPTYVLGEMKESKISEELSKHDIGISTTPYYQIEKSGTVAAMLEHALPVVCVARSWTPRDVIIERFPEGICEYKVEHLDQILTTLVEPSNSEYNLSRVSSLMVRDLQKC